ncbi:MAG: nicotinate-nucleotide--dimethylbenzimidazole phosphoribosyltransferase [Spirochaetia bacterium]|nr:nicotinate-nucleotide--dimethylbenzimidazole phosphoribosyltransferase [Spirochaetia bacterium]
MDTIKRTIERIAAPDQAARAAAAARQARLTKPEGSLGVLEELSIRIAGMQGKAAPSADPSVVFVMAADHGVCAEGISAYPAEVTAQMLCNFAAGGAAINAIAAAVGARVVIADVGVAAELPRGLAVHRRKIAYGTRNMAQLPAMTRVEALRSIASGIEIFEEELSAAPFAIAAIGDMGIGNTTAAAALASVFTGRSPAELVGRGTGLDDAALERKIAVVERALALHRPAARDPAAVLTAVGGFEIGAMAGIILAAAAHRVPLVVDGYITGAAALLAAALAPASRDYMIAGHLSADKGHGLMLSALGLEPLLDLGMRLGEGTGAALAMGICKAACASLNSMATFEAAGVGGKL